MSETLNDSLHAFMTQLKDFKNIAKTPNSIPSHPVYEFSDYLLWKQTLRLEEIRNALDDIAAELNTLNQS